jgi:hypothetical protein
MLRKESQGHEQEAMTIGSHVMPLGEPDSQPRSLRKHRQCRSKAWLPNGPQQSPNVLEGIRPTINTHTQHSCTAFHFLTHINRKNTPPGCIYTCITGASTLRRHRCFRMGSAAELSWSPGGSICLCAPHSPCSDSSSVQDEHEGLAQPSEAVRDIQQRSAVPDATKRAQQTSKTRHFLR